MDKRVVAAVVVVVVAGIGVLLVSRRGEKGAVKSVEPYPFPALKVNQPKDPKKRATWESPLVRDVDRLEITRKGKTIVIRRVEKGTKKNDVGRWEIVSPFHYPANKTAIQSLIRRLERLDFWEVLTKNPGDFKDAGVDEGSAIRLRVFAGDKLLADMLVGKTMTAKVGERTQTYTAVRKAGTNTVWKLMGSMKYVLDKELDKWRKDQIVGRRRDDMALFAILDRRGGYVAATRNPDETDPSKKYENWVLLAANPKIDKLSQVDFGRAASAVSTMRASDFADDAHPDQAGLTKPDRILVAVYKKKGPSGAKPSAQKAEESRSGGKERARQARPGMEPTKKGARTGGTAATRGAARPAGKQARSSSGASDERFQRLRSLVARIHPAPDPGIEAVLAKIKEKMADPSLQVFVVLVGKQKPKEKKYFVKLADQDQIFLVRDYAIRSALAKVIDFRDKTVVSIPPEKVTEIIVEHEKGRVHLKKEKGSWKALEPKDLDADLNRPMVKRVVEMLKSRFRARKFADTTDPAKTGLGKPKGRIVIKADGKTYEILVGGEAERGKRYVQLKGSPNVYVMGAYPLNQLYKEPKRWRKPKSARR